MDTLVANKHDKTLARRAKLPLQRMIWNLSVAILNSTWAYSPYLSVGGWSLSDDGAGLW